MRLVDAVYLRICELSDKSGLNKNSFANRCGVPRSTIATMTKSSTVKLSTLQGVCDGLEISLKEFFDSPLFERKNIID